MNENKNAIVEASIQSDTVGSYYIHQIQLAWALK